MELLDRPKPGVKSRITAEIYARIPTLIEQGMTKAEIAAMCGVTPGTLAVQCCRHGVSLRKGGSRPRRIRSTMPLSDSVFKSLHKAARAMGRDTAQLANDLLEKIVNDNLYKAVLDEEAA
jgi:hypothetical protein